jgi:hypothetical protein
MGRRARHVSASNGLMRGGEFAKMARIRIRRGRAPLGATGIKDLTR